MVLVATRIEVRDSRVSDVKVDADADVLSVVVVEKWCGVVWW
jgi:hypothetical protein